jgi:hypothetical protein
MSGRRGIFFSRRCDAAAEILGGYRRIDEALDAVWDALSRNPYGLPKCECDWFSARYIVTKPYGDAPALVWLIIIEPSGDVIIDHVEEYEDY